MAEILTELVAKITTDAAGLKSGLSDAEKQTESSSKKMSASFKQIGTSMSNVGKQLSMKITAPIVGLGTAAFKMSGDFDQAFRKTNVMLKASAEEAVNYKKRLLEISSATGKGAGDVADAFYQIISAGYRGADSLDILETAMKGAVGGAAETESTMAALTKAMNIFGMQGVGGATKAMDIFFGVVDTGLLDFNQMASAFPTAASSAAGLGVSIEEVGAALGTLTKVTASTETAGMALMNAFMMLIKPSDKLVDLYHEWGVSTGPEAIEKFGGFAGVLNKVKEATGGNVDELAELFPSIRALKAVLPLVTTNADDYAAALDMVSGSSGRTSDAFNEMAQGPGFQLQQTLTAIKNTSIRLGDTLASYLTPILKTISEKVEKLIGWWESLDKGLQQAIIYVVIATAVIPPLIYILGQLVIAVTVLGTTTNLMFGGILLAIGLVITGIFLLWQNWDKVSKAIARAGAWLVDRIMINVNIMVEGFAWLMRQIAGFVNLFSHDWATAIYNAADKMTKSVKDFGENIVKSLTDFVDSCEKSHKSLVKVGETAVDTAKDVDVLVKSVDQGTKATEEFIAAQKRLEASLTSVLGEGNINMASVLSSQKGSYRTEEEWANAMASMGNIYTGEGWITPQHSEQQYQQALEQYGTPEESIKGYQHGGLVNETGLAYLHEGETVIPANESMGNVVINFTQPVFFDREDDMNRFVDKISKTLDRKYRLSGRLA